MNLDNLVWVLDPSGDEEDSPPYCFLGRKNEGWNERGYRTHSVDELSLNEIVDFLDEECESANYHSLVGTHRVLAMLIEDIVGEEVTFKIMAQIANSGGLLDLEYKGINND